MIRIRYQLLCLVFFLFPLLLFIMLTICLVEYVTIRIMFIYLSFCVCTFFLRFSTVYLDYIELLWLFLWDLFIFIPIRIYFKLSTIMFTICLVDFMIRMSLFVCFFSALITFLFYGLLILRKIIVIIYVWSKFQGRKLLMTSFHYIYRS